MALESGSYVGDLNVANPSGTDPKSQGDDHIRLLKAAARNSFPGFAGVVAGTGVESGSASAFVVALAPAPAAYAAGMMVVFKATHANAGAATLQVNALAAKTLKAVDGSALEAGDIENGAVVGAFYDGTDFFLISGADRAARGGDSYSGTHDFTGATVQVATAGAGDNSTKAASTAYVDAADALKANLASPALTGTPTAPTAAPGTNTTQVATTAFATQLAFQAALPAQTVPALLYSNGTVASWRAAFAGDAGAGGEAGPVPAPAAGDAAKFLRGNGLWARVPICPDVIAIDQKSNGTAPDSFLSTGYVDRTLNSLLRNQDGVASLSSNAISLPAGVWFLRGRAPLAGHQSYGLAQRGRLRIYNFTASQSIAVGPTNGSSADGDCCLLEVFGIVTLASTSYIKLQQYVTDSSRSIGGYAIGSGDYEVYGIVEATRIE